MIWIRLFLLFMYYRYPSFSYPLFPSVQPPPLAFTTLLSLYMDCIYTFTYVFWLIFSTPPHTLPSEICQSVSCIHASSFIFLYVYSVYQIPHKSEIILYLSFSDWLISLRIINFRSIHTVTWVRVPSFLQLCSIPLCKCTISFLSTQQPRCGNSSSAHQQTNAHGFLILPVLCNVLWKVLANVVCYDKVYGIEMVILSLFPDIG